MRFNNPLNHILDSKAKIICLRLLCNSPTDINGRQLSKIVKLSPTTVHKAMKELAYEQVVLLNNYGNSHVYELNKRNKIVAEILKPLFDQERKLFENFIEIILKRVKASQFRKKIISIVLFGSVHARTENPRSDIDVCVVVKEQKDLKGVEELLFDINFETMPSIGMGLQPYLKTLNEFKKDKNLKVVKSILKSNKLIWGERLEKMK